MAVVLHAEAAYPAVEDLDGVGSGAYLLSRIFTGDGDQLAHEFIPRFGRGVHHFLGVNVITRTAAFDHIAGQSKRSATEADHRELVAEMFADQRNCL